MPLSTARRKVLHAHQVLWRGVAQGGETQGYQGDKKGRKRNGSAVDGERCRHLLHLRWRLQAQASLHSATTLAATALTMQAAPRAAATEAAQAC